MTTCPLVYPPKIHDIYREAVALLHADICEGRVPPTGQSPKLEIDCPNGCENHRVEVNVTAVRQRIIRINTSAHDFLKTYLANRSVLEQRAYHAGVLDISRQYLPLLDKLIVQKNIERQRARHLRDRARSSEENRAIRLLVETDAVSAEHLLEFMSCYRKHRYTTEAAASTSLSEGVHGADDGLIVYDCTHCGGWHVGHAMGATTPLMYRLSRAKMFWGVRRELANQFVQERGLYAHPLIKH